MTLPCTMTSALEHLRANTFEARDADIDPPRACVGDFVKVGIRGERFWCEVQSVGEGGTFHAIVDNDLLRSNGARGHVLALQREHILESASITDKLTFQRLAAVTGSEQEAALLWYNARAWNSRNR